MTPGPWIQAGYAVHAEDPDGKHWHIASCEDLEDAEAIAALPELVETLEDFILDHDNGLGPSVDRLRALLAKVPR